MTPEQYLQKIKDELDRPFIPLSRKIYQEEFASSGGEWLRELRRKLGLEGKVSDEKILDAMVNFRPEQLIENELRAARALAQRDGHAISSIPVGTLNALEFNAFASKVPNGEGHVVVIDFVVAAVLVNHVIVPA